MHIAREIFSSTSDTIRKDVRAPVHTTRNRPCIWIQEELVGIEAQAFARRIASVHAVAVQCARADVLHPAMPDIARLLWQCDAGGFFAVGLVEQAQLDTARPWREQRAGGAVAVPGGAEWIRATSPAGPGRG